MTAPEVPHADLIARLRKEIQWQAEGSVEEDLMTRAADALAALGDTVPREHYEEAVHATNVQQIAMRRLSAERDALAHVIEQVRRWKMARQTGAGGSYAALTAILAAAPAVSLALHDAEVKAQALDDFATFISGSRADGLSGWTIAQIRLEAKNRAAAIREEAGRG